MTENYFIHPGDRESEDYHPDTILYSGCHVTPLIDGYDYFIDLLHEIDKLGSSGAGNPAKQGIYIAGWWFDVEFEFPEPDSDGDKNLLTILEKKKNDGVDVKILAWASNYVLDIQELTLGDMFIKTRLDGEYALIEYEDEKVFPESVCDTNIKSIYVLRQGPLINSAMLNTLDHPLGSAHSKFLTVFNGQEGVGYTGGLDFAKDRISKSHHMNANMPSGSIWHSTFWHDVGVKVKGPVVKAMYDYFRFQWNSLIQRDDNPLFLINDPYERVHAKTGNEAEVDESSLSSNPIPSINHKVQSIRTFPSYFEPWFIWSEQRVFGAEYGIYEAQLALKKSISEATNYIYIEDQLMWSREIFGYLRDAIVNNPNLNLILVTGDTDPNDPAPSGYRDVAMNQYLLSGLKGQQLNRIRYYSLKFKVCHSKLWIVDDVWAMVGSTNMFNRSLYTDIEHSISFSHDTLVKNLRIELWGEHFGMPPTDVANSVTVRTDKLTDLDLALSIWEPTWGGGSTVKLPHNAEFFDEVPGEGVWPDGLLSTLAVRIYNGIITATSTSQIVDAGLSIFSNVLGSCMIRIMAGPNIGRVRVVVNQDEINNVLTLNRPFPQENTDGTTYEIYGSRLVPLQIPRPGNPEASFGIFDRFNYEYLGDYGQHP